MLKNMSRVPDLVKVPEDHRVGCSRRDLPGRTMNPVGIITRIGRAPGIRRLVRKHERDGVVTESPDPEDRDPRWCAACGREVLLGVARCLHCGGAPQTAAELARRHGDLPPPGRGPASWEL
jgi:hypothetical protein